MSCRSCSSRRRLRAERRACAVPPSCVTGSSDRLAVMAAACGMLGISASSSIRMASTSTGGTLGRNGIERERPPDRDGICGRGTGRAGTRARLRCTANVATSFPGFAELARGVGFGLETANPEVETLTRSGHRRSTDRAARARARVARAVGDGLGWHLLDSGALYRLAALAAGRAGVARDDPAGLARVASGLDVRFGPARTETNGSSSRRRGRHGGHPERELCASAASRVAVVPSCAAALVDLQRSFRAPPAWWRTAGTWGASSSRRPG